MKILILAIIIFIISVKIGKYMLWQAEIKQDENRRREYSIAKERSEKIERVTYDLYGQILNEYREQIKRRSTLVTVDGNRIGTKADNGMLRYMYNSNDFSLAFRLFLDYDSEGMKISYFPEGYVSKISVDRNGYIEYEPGQVNWPYDREMYDMIVDEVLNGTTPLTSNSFVRNRDGHVVVNVMLPLEEISGQYFVKNSA